MLSFKTGEIGKAMLATLFVRVESTLAFRERNPIVGVGVFLEPCADRRRVRCGFGLPTIMQRRLIVWSAQEHAKSTRGHHDSQIRLCRINRKPAGALAGLGLHLSMGQTRRYVTVLGLHRQPRLQVIADSAPLSLTSLAQALQWQTESLQRGNDLVARMRFDQGL